MVYKRQNKGESKKDQKSPRFLTSLTIMTICSTWRPGSISGHHVPAIKLYLELWHIYRVVWLAVTDW